MKILVLNAGSSTQKSCLYNLSDNILPDSAQEGIWEANIDWTVATGQGILTVKSNKNKQKITLNSDDRRQGIAKMLDTLISGETKVIETLVEIKIVGHRVVHGGTNYTKSTLITPEVKAEITRLIPLAPNHNPAHIEDIEAIEQLLGNIPQVAVFDTAFHTSMPLETVAYPIPYEWLDKGIRRYGFHGISHQYCAHRAAKLLKKTLSSLKLITCHLGNGCSLTAIKDGISIDTTMGFTPLEGLMMGTRSGSIDPTILIYLMREYNLTAEELNNLLNKESGFKGVSGISADLRAILQGINDGNYRAKLAFDMYIHRLRSHIGAMLASLGGLDALIFTAGVGENAPIVREKACSAFEFLGLKLDKQKNESSPVDVDISTPESSIKILVIHTEEDWAIAQDCWHLLTTGLTQR
ncbi:acetate kinase [Aphanothece sacrum]|uniref:Acetate kinase n=1 Tax=Aphanothece sacrum FPU1 TaxID=1920663 RepID=A0A401IMR3_APHSA|nr:acetate kinase [Aphanothece sacrum]GBF82560.1 acetate kinase [Aphanothece sacrum FPU1]GBF84694.1 acetate kinase [Aphanothece sacrum FPU3]